MIRCSKVKGRRPIFSQNHRSFCSSSQRSIIRNSTESPSLDSSVTGVGKGITSSLGFAFSIAVVERIGQRRWEVLSESRKAFWRGLALGADYRQVIPACSPVGRWGGSGAGGLGSSACSFRYQIPVNNRVPTTKPRTPISREVIQTYTLSDFCTKKITYKSVWFFKGQLNPV